MPIRKINERGQSAIEFVLVFAFGLGLVFLFVNLAINTTSGYLVHYVNFMAARAYMVEDRGIDTDDFDIARQKAIEVFNSYNIQDFGVDANFKVQTHLDGHPLFTGTITQFRKKLSSLPLVGGGDSALFYSESFLGKEPLRNSCYKSTCTAVTGGAQGCKRVGIVLYDNGC